MRSGCIPESLAVTVSLQHVLEAVRAGVGAPGGPQQEGPGVSVVGEWRVTTGGGGADGWYRRRSSPHAI